MNARYAVFFCPDDASDLAAYGQRVLGRTAEGMPVAKSSDDFPDRQIAALLSATPAHYGFHATLKAPFHLSDDSSEEGLLAAVEALAGQQTSIIMQTLQPRRLAEFVALGFENQPEAIARLAARCVESFEPFRAPLTKQDLHKRNPDQLTETQKSYLYRYGYPYVMSEFRFHMTLSASISRAEHSDYVDWLKTLYVKLIPRSPVLDRLAVFWQPDRDTAFTRLVEFPFRR
ncbi:MAG: DUF1045 domain-containing protein [Granulosicoccus sp.]